MPRIVAVKIGNDLDDRCQTCDGLVGRDKYASSERGLPLRPTTLCPDCAGTVSRCAVCREWLALHWFNSAGSTTCTLCLDMKKQRRPWTPEQGKRLYDTGRAVFDLWSRHVDLWTEDELEVWRNFLAAMERMRRNEL